MGGQMKAKRLAFATFLIRLSTSNPSEKFGTLSRPPASPTSYRRNVNKTLHSFVV